MLIPLRFWNFRRIKAVNIFKLQMNSLKMFFYIFNFNTQFDI